jgi:hypothetical protein
LSDPTTTVVTPDSGINSLVVRFYSVKAVTDLLNTLKKTGAFTLPVASDRPKTLNISVLFRTSQRGEKFHARILSWNKGISILEPMLDLTDFSTMVSSLVEALKEDETEGEQAEASSDDLVIPFEEGHPPVLPKFTPEAHNNDPELSLSPFDTAHPKSRLSKAPLLENTTAKKMLVTDLISSEGPTSSTPPPPEQGISKEKETTSKDTPHTPGSSGFLSNQTNPQARKGAFSPPQKEAEVHDIKEEPEKIEKPPEEQKDDLFSQLSSSVYDTMDSRTLSVSSANKQERKPDKWINPNSLACAAQFLTGLADTIGIQEIMATPASGREVCELVSEIKTPEPGSLIVANEQDGKRTWYLFIQNSTTVAAYQTPIPLEQSYTHILSKKGLLKPDSVARAWRLITAYKLSEENVLLRLRLINKATLSALIADRTEAVLSNLRMVPVITYQIQQLSAFPEELESGQSDHLRFSLLYNHYLSMNTSDRTASINSMKNQNLRLKIRPDILSETLELDKAMESLFVDCFTGMFSVEMAVSKSPLSLEKTESALLSIMDMEWVNKTND